MQTVEINKPDECVALHAQGAADLLRSDAACGPNKSTIRKRERNSRSAGPAQALARLCVVAHRLTDVQHAGPVQCAGGHLGAVQDESAPANPRNHC